MLIKRSIIAFLLFICAGAALAAGEDDAHKFVDNVGKQVLKVINGNAPESEKQQQLRQLFTQYVDIDWMGKFVLGRGWRQATEDQRRRYMEAYRKYLLSHYTTDFRDYTGSNYNITDVKKEEEGQFVVGMEIKSPHAKQQQIQAGYRVRLENGQFKIIDIIVEGVSLITTQRSDFSSTQQQNGMDSLIDALEKKGQTESNTSQTK